jgi:RNA polymerase sigma-70 factor (ECF subfamily)
MKQHESDTVHGGDGVKALGGSCATVGSDIATRPRASGRSVMPVHLALRDGLRRFVARRVRPEHVDDLLQDVLLRMHERAGDLHDEARLPAWAFRVAQSVVVDHHRRRRLELAAGDADEHEPESEPDDAGNVNEVVAGWLRPMLALLPAEYEEAVELVDVQGLSQRGYAERAGLSISGAKSRVQRGRRMLEEIVRACCDLELDARGNVIGYERRHCGCDADGSSRGACGSDR